MIDVVRRFAGSRGLLDSPGIVAVSGGPDSVALMRSLHEVGCGSLTLAHVNHRLRGEESDADELFVRDLATQLGCDVRALSLDTQADIATRGENLEAGARRIRYEWFESLAGELGATWIATGHTADDQAETLLHRLIRGTGLQGLRGIAETRDVSHYCIVRPLLNVSRADVIAYLASHSQEFRTDSSNADRRFTRNRIRHELMPMLTSMNPEVVASLGELAAQSAAAFEVVEAAAAELLANAEKPQAGRMRIFDAERLAKGSAFLVCEAFRAVWAREAWPMGGMTAEHWKRLAAIVHGDSPAVDFPGGVRVRRVGRVVQVERES